MGTTRINLLALPDLVQQKSLQYFNSFVSFCEQGKDRQLNLITLCTPLFP